MRVPPKLMAHVRDSARIYGKSDPIDALAVARAAQSHVSLGSQSGTGPATGVTVRVLKEAAGVSTGAPRLGNVRAMPTLP